MTWPDAALSQETDDLRSFEIKACELLETVLAQPSRILEALKVCSANWHPNGFAVFRLGEVDGYQVRLHVWVPLRDNPLAWHPPVHSHDRHISSIVILGQKNDIIWNSEKANSDQDVRQEVYSVNRRDVASELLRPTGSLVTAQIDRSTIYRRGHLLSQAAGVFHEIPLNNGAPFATLCIKGNVVDSNLQSVIDTRGQPARIVTRTQVNSIERKSILEMLRRGFAKPGG
jgi:hypothetical protein